MHLRELATLLDCRYESLPEGPEGEVSGIASLENAGPNDVSFLTDARRAAGASHSRARALIVAENFPGFDLPSAPLLLRCPNPVLAAARAVALLRPAWRPLPGISPLASVHPTARLGQDCYAGPFAVISEHCSIGDGAVIHAHAVLYPNVKAGARLLVHAHAVIREDTELGDDVVLQPGVIIGGDGFGFTADADGHQVKIPQVGRVVIGNGVEIQANSCVDRSSLDATRIGDRVKIDNLTQVAHSCTVGADTVLCAQVGLAGSTHVGARAILAGQAGVAGHCTIGDGAIITAQSGTHGDLAPNKMYSGSPAFDHAQWLRATAAFQRLGDMQRELRQLRQRLEQLEALQSKPQ